MDMNLSLIADELFAKIRSQFPSIELEDEKGDPTDEPKLARSFKFDFKKKHLDLGSIEIDISDDDGMVIIFSNDIISKQPDRVRKLWFNFTRELREFAKQKMLNYQIRDINLNQLEKRDGETQMTESKLWGTSKTSYQDLGETKIIIKHTQPVNLNLAAGRTMHIESIFIENDQGERFRYPYRHLNGARALAQHVGHGGTSYDDIGTHIIGLSEEMSKLKMFKSYVERNPVVSEAMSDVNSKVLERIQEVKKEIHNLQKSSYYEEFAESFTSKSNNEIPEEIINDWVDRLTIKTFNEELKNVFPYIYKLVGEDNLPIRVINPEDIGGVEIKDTTEQIQDEIDELVDFEGYLNRLVGEGTDIFSNDEDQQAEAVQKLNELVSQELPVGPDGSNATGSLKDIIDDDELFDIFKELADVSPESDVRPILKDYIKIKDEENGTDVLGKINFPEGDQAPEPAEEPEAAPAAPAPAPDAAAPAPEAPAVPPTMPMTPGVAMQENIKRVIEKAKAAGMTQEDTFTLFGEEVTLGDAIRRVGLDLNEFFGDGYKDSGDEVVEFVRSMFDEEGNTPKGPTGVLISVEKKFGEEALSKAKSVMNELMTQAEMRRIQELSGLSTQEGFGDMVNYAAGKAGEFAGGAAKLADKKIQGYKDLGNKISQKASQFGSDIAQGASNAVDAATSGYQQARLGYSQPLGQAGQPDNSKLGQDIRGQDSSKMTQPPGTGPKNIGQTPPSMGKGIPRKGQPAMPESSELAAMLRIAGLR